MLSILHSKYEFINLFGIDNKITNYIIGFPLVFQITETCSYDIYT